MRQEFLNTVYGRLKAQHRPAYLLITPVLVDEEEELTGADYVAGRYRTDDGLGCAIGVMLPATWNPKKIEGEAIESAVHKMPLFLRNIFFFNATSLDEQHKSLRFWGDLQGVHDMALEDAVNLKTKILDVDEFWKSFNTRINNFAKVWNLQSPVEVTNG